MESPSLSSIILFTLYSCIRILLDESYGTFKRRLSTCTSVHVGVHVSTRACTHAHTHRIEFIGSHKEKALWVVLDIRILAQVTVCVSIRNP